MENTSIHIHYHNSNECELLKELLTKMEKLEMKLDEIKAQLLAAVTLLNSNNVALAKIQTEVVTELQNLSAAAATIQTQAATIAAASNAELPADLIDASTALNTALGNLNSQVQAIDSVITPVVITPVVITPVETQSAKSAPQAL